MTCLQTPTNSNQRVVLDPNQPMPSTCKSNATATAKSKQTKVVKRKPTQTKSSNSIPTHANPTEKEAHHANESRSPPTCWCAVHGEVIPNSNTSAFVQIVMVGGVASIAGFPLVLSGCGFKPPTPSHSDNWVCPTCVESNQVKFDSQQRRKPNSHVGPTSTLENVITPTKPSTDKRTTNTTTVITSASANAVSTNTSLVSSPIKPQATWVARRGVPEEFLSKTRGLARTPTKPLQSHNTATQNTAAHPFIQSRPPPTSPVIKKQKFQVTIVQQHKENQKPGSPTLPTTTIPLMDPFKSSQGVQHSPPPMFG